MSSTETTAERATAIPAAATADLKLEVVVLPVADVERARRFYAGLGWRLDADFNNGADWHLVQMTPPGSPCSRHVRQGIHDGRAGLGSGKHPRRR